MSSLIADKESIRAFLLGGKAIFTIENRETKARFTFKVNQKKNGDIYWVSLLNGADNTKDYRFFGTLFPTVPLFKHSAAGKITAEAPSAKAFKWFFDRLNDTKAFPPQFEFHHAGRCAKCSRLLTVTDSLRRGFGPDCAQMLAA